MRVSALTSSRSSIITVVLLASCLFVAGRSPAAVFSADAVKAAFLYRFASYVQWPADLPAEGPFVIGIVDADPIADQLEHLLPGMRVHGRAAEVRRVKKPSDLDGVRILYLGPGSRSNAVRQKATSLPILLVTDREDGFGGGGVINFIDAPRNVRFEVSLVAADRARLTIDSALLAVAARVERRAQSHRLCEGCNGPDVAAAP